MYPKQKSVEVDHSQGQAVTFNFDLSGEAELNANKDKVS